MNFDRVYRMAQKRGVAPQALVLDVFSRFCAGRSGLYLALASMVLIVIWAVTPASDWITDFVVNQIPISRDVELGMAAVKSAKYKVRMRVLLHCFPFNRLRLNHYTVFVPMFCPPRQVVTDTYGVRTLGESLTKHLPKDLLAQYRFSFQVIDSPDVNAWAYPGGMIFITTSLIKQMKLSRDEIAAVLGHEIGHVVSRHSQKEIIKQNVMSWIVSAFIREVWHASARVCGSGGVSLVLVLQSF